MVCCNAKTQENAKITKAAFKFAAGNNAEEVCVARVDELKHRLKLESTGPAGFTSLTAAYARTQTRCRLCVRRVGGPWTFEHRCGLSVLITSF